MEQETRPGRLMFISRGGSRAGQAQAASPPSGCELRPRPRHCGSVPAPPGRAGASRPPAARAGAGAAAAVADNGGRAGGGQADSTSLPGPPSAALPSERLRDGRDRKWSGRRDRGAAATAPSSAGSGIPDPRRCCRRHRPRAALMAAAGAPGTIAGRRLRAPAPSPLPRALHPSIESSAPSPSLIPPPRRGAFCHEPVDPTPTPPHQQRALCSKTSAPAPCPLLRALHPGIEPSP